MKKLTLLFLPALLGIALVLGCSTAPKKESVPTETILKENKKVSQHEEDLLEEGVPDEMPPEHYPDADEDSENAAENIEEENED